jgi:hypothetical protein
VHILAPVRWLLGRLRWGRKRGLLRWLLHHDVIDVVRLCTDRHVVQAYAGQSSCRSGCR